jgi:hypothetical protein
MLTPYAAHKVVNNALEEAGVDKQIPAQMMYNYTSARLLKNKKPLIECEVIEGKVVIKEEVLNEWIKKYLTKQLATL